VAGGGHTGRTPSALACAECGRRSDGDAFGWRAYGADLPPEAEAEAEAEDLSTPEVPPVVVFCSACAERQFDT